MLLLLSLTTLSFAGYGDAVDGLPSLEERRVFLWTNAARVEPSAFKDDYTIGECSFDSDFSEDEKTPKAPVAWNADLNEAARFHSVDMNSNNHFAHASSDGTPAMQRIARFYSGRASENIAWGTNITPRASVLSMWMCSTTGHRGNIMNGTWNELGTGVDGLYYTQNFGQADIDVPGISMGVHWSEGGQLVFRADAYDQGGVAPDRVEVIVNGEPTAMALEYGDADRGIYRGSRTSADVAETEMAGCTEYYFEAAWGEGELAEVARFPETGSYAFGSCTFADADAMFLNRQLEVEEEGGCSTVAAPTGMGLAGGLVGLLLLGRRRREA